MAIPGVGLLLLGGPKVGDGVGSGGKVEAGGGKNEVEDVPVVVVPVATGDELELPEVGSPDDMVVPE